VGIGLHRRLVSIGAALVGVALLVACPDEAPRSAPAPERVAVVNGEDISGADFQAYLDEIKQAGKGYFQNTETASRIKRDLLERMIDKRLLLQEARKRRITLDPKLVEASMSLVRKGYPDGGVSDQLKAKGRDMEHYRQETEVSLTIARLLKQEVVDRIAISREDIEKHYNQNRERFVRPEEVRVRQIVTREKEQAEELRKQILRGAKFEELASKNSLGPEATKGGDLGYFPRGRMPPEIEEVCFKLWAGSKASKVIESPYGFHLFQLVDKRPARELSLDDARAEIERALLDARTKEAERFFIRSLREQASIERDLQRLDRIQ
jgi:peptidyl-prolyl cis-trans isomerase C